MRHSAAHGPNTPAPALGAMNDPEPTCGTPPLKRLVAARFRSDHDGGGYTRPGLIVGTLFPPGHTIGPMGKLPAGPWARWDRAHPTDPHGPRGLSPPASTSRRAGVVSS